MNNNIFEIIKTYKAKFLTVDEIKSILRVSHDYDDLHLQNLITAGIEAAENFTGLSLNMRDIKLTINNYNEEGIRLKFMPIINIEKAFYIIGQDQRKIDYRLDPVLGKLFINDLPQNAQLVIFYKVGYAAESIPAMIKQGIVEHISNMYDNPNGPAGMLSEQIRSYYLPYRFFKI